MAPHHAALVEDPAVDGGVLALERRQQLPDGRAVELVVGAVARESLEGLPEADRRHQSNLSTDRMFPAGSRNHAMSGPCACMIPFSSWGAPS